MTELQKKSKQHLWEKFTTNFAFYILYRLNFSICWKESLPTDFVQKKDDKEETNEGRRTEQEKYRKFGLAHATKTKQIT